MNDEEYAPPRFPAKLDWYQLFRGASQAGEILGAFELLQVIFAHFEPNMEFYDV